MSRDPHRNLGPPINATEAQVSVILKRVRFLTDITQARMVTLMAPLLKIRDHGGPWLGQKESQIAAWHPSELAAVGTILAARQSDLVEAQRLLETAIALLATKHKP